MLKPQPHTSFDSLIHSNWTWPVNGMPTSKRRAKKLGDRFRTVNGAETDLSESK